MMKDLKKDYRIVDIRNGAVRKIGEHNFLSMRLPRKIGMVAPIQVVKI